MLTGSAAILILSASALPMAERIRASLDGNAVIYAAAGKIADYPQEFFKFSEFIQEIYQQNRPIIAICASGIVIRALAPILGQFAERNQSKTALGNSLQEPPILSMAIDGSSIVPLLGVTSGANELAYQIAQKLNTHAAITTSGELSFGINLLMPPPDLELVNRDAGKNFISKLLDGESVCLTGASHGWLSQSRLPVCEEAALQIHIALEEERVETSKDRLVYRLIEGVRKDLSRGGRVTIVGLGPGDHRQRTKAVSQALREADDILGYGFYVDQAKPPLPHQKLHYSDNGHELDRARAALALAKKGRRAVLVSSGDAGVFGMAAAFFEILDREQLAQSVQRFSNKSCGKNKEIEKLPKTASSFLDKKCEQDERQEQRNTSIKSGNILVREDSFDIDIVVEPGVTAALAASSRFGAPLGGDFAIISLSDNLKPQELIEKRLRLAAQADMALALYNPVSKVRSHQIERALVILGEERAPTIPVGLATDIGRADERILLTKLADIQLADITSRTVIIVGSSQSRIFEYGARQWFYTPRSIGKGHDF